MSLLWPTPLSDNGSISAASPGVNPPVSTPADYPTIDNYFGPFRLSDPSTWHIPAPWDLFNFSSGNDSGNTTAQPNPDANNAAVNSPAPPSLQMTAALLIGSVVLLSFLARKGA